MAGLTEKEIETGSTSEQREKVIVSVIKLRRRKDYDNDRHNGDGLDDSELDAKLAQANAIRGPSHAGKASRNAIVNC
jgi:hypothetical protein